MAELEAKPSLEGPIEISTQEQTLAQRCCPPEVRKKVLALFADKGCTVVVGWVWNEAITSSIEAILSRHRRGLSQDDNYSGEERLIGSILGYLISLVISACMQHVLSNSQGLFAKTLNSGLALMPAWGFKHCVSSFMANMNDLVKTDLNALWAVLVLIFSSGLSHVCPTKEAGAPIYHTMFASIGSSTALGNGFAFNQIFKQAAGDRWNTCEFQVLYAPLITWMAAKAQGKLSTRFKEAEVLLEQLSKNHDGIASKQEDLQRKAEELKQKAGDFKTKKLLASLKKNIQFSVAWAWDALFEATFDAWWEEPNKNGAKVLRECIWALIISAGGVFVCVDGGDGEVWDLLEQVVGPNVGWAWSDFAKAIYNASAADGDSQVVLLLKLWAITLGITAIVPPIYYLLNKYLKDPGQQQLSLFDDQLTQAVATRIDAAKPTRGIGRATE